jgi:hypothetical protein
LYVDVYKVARGGGLRQVRLGDGLIG